MKVQIESFCGARCESCVQRKNNACGGCFAAKKTPLHRRCKIVACVQKKQIRFCGECETFPCKLLQKQLSRNSQGEAAQACIDRCREWKTALVRQAQEGINPVSICGHHCDFCFLGQWCGGCRSDYNCCSFAGLFADGKCPNVTCAAEKGLDGCYACGELEGCAKGYYARPGEYVAKATAHFIQKYGQACYSAALKKTIESGVDYPKAFDAAGSVDGALEILERYCEAKTRI